MQQAWLKQRLDTFLPALMRTHGIDLWVVPMREYNEDPVFTSITAPETFAARRRTIYVFFDKCAATKARPSAASCIERIALGGTSQGGVFDARTSTKPVVAPPSAAARPSSGATNSGRLLKQVIEERKPSVIGIDRSTVFAFSDGLSSGELKGMTEALGPAWTSKFKDAERLPLDLIASRLPEEEAFFQKMTALVWQMTQTMFSDKVIVPGQTRTSDLVWWWRQRDERSGPRHVVPAEHRSAAPGRDVREPRARIPSFSRATCCTATSASRSRGSTPTRSTWRTSCARARPTRQPVSSARSPTATRCRTTTMEEIRPGRTGNEILAAVLARMKAAKIDGTLYSHPIGMNGHGAGPLIGLWDYQDGVPGRGDAKVIPSMWFSIELQATTPVAEWGRSAQCGWRRKKT